MQSAIGAPHLPGGAAMGASSARVVQRVFEDVGGSRIIVWSGREEHADPHGFPRGRGTGGGRRPEEGGGPGEGGSGGLETSRGVFTANSQPPLICSRRGEELAPGFMGGAAPT